jgi:hypothetical protein
VQAGAVQLGDRAQLGLGAERAQTGCGLFGELLGLPGLAGVHHPPHLTRATVRRWARSRAQAAAQPGGGQQDPGAAAERGHDFTWDPRWRGQRLWWADRLTAEGVQTLQQADTLTLEADLGIARGIAGAGIENAD